MILRRTLACALLLHFLATPARAAEVPVPVHVQLPLFTKIWKLDRNFPSDGTTTVAVIYQESHGPSVAVKNQVTSWTNGSRSVRALPVAIDGVRGLEDLRGIEADVFYIAPMRGADFAAITSIARARKIRTNTGVPEYVDSGIAVGIAVRNDRPLIVINVPASKAEGSSFPAQLLQLARLVRQ